MEDNTGSSPRLRALRLPELTDERTKVPLNLYFASWFSATAPIAPDKVQKPFESPRNKIRVHLFYLHGMASRNRKRIVNEGQKGIHRVRDRRFQGSWSPAAANQRLPSFLALSLSPLPSNPQHSALTIGGGVNVDVRARWTS